LVVTEVDPKGPFGKAGFEKGDIILQVENNPVDSPDTLLVLLSTLRQKHKATVLAVDHTSGQSAAVQITLP
jgi:S1-C subfamily serine protease